MKEAQGTSHRRFAHVTLIMQESHGIANKLEGMAIRASQAAIPLDFYWLTRSGNFAAQTYSSLRIVGVGQGNAFAIRARQAREINTLLERYDGVVLRYPLWDPVLSLLLRQSRRIVLEHHTKEIEELRHQKDPRWFTEHLLGSRWIRGFGGLVGVTPEIVSYEMERSRFRRGVEFIPNSFDVDSDLTRDNMIRPPSDREPLRLVMSASFFSGWHGLDRILDALEQEEEEAWELHLAGRLPEDLQQRVARLKSVISHGHLGRDELRKLYLSCHVGLSSFSLERMGLTQATTLKVREYLSLGLPVVLGHVDPALPEDFPFALRQESFNLAGIVSFISSIGNHSRREVAESSVPYIDTLPVLNKLLSFCSRVLHEQSCGETR